MMKSDPVLKQTDSFVFVLWGEHFEEAAAAIFATKLRQAGLCVKLVGLASQRPMGKNGLALYPDISLRQAMALAGKAICAILPCSAATLKHVEADPRIMDFFKKSYANGARFVVSTADLVQKTGLKKMAITEECLSTYEGENNLLRFADELADELAGGLATVYGL